FEAVERVVADRLRAAQFEDRAPRGGEGAPPQRIGREFAGYRAVGVALGAQQQRAVFQPQDFRGLRRVAVDLVERRTVGDGAGAADFGGDRVIVLQAERRDQGTQRQA